MEAEKQKVAELALGNALARYYLPCHSRASVNDAVLLTSVKI